MTEREVEIRKRIPLNHMCFAFMYDDDSETCEQCDASNPCSTASLMLDEFNKEINKKIIRPLCFGLMYEEEFETCEKCELSTPCASSKTILNKHINTENKQKLQSAFKCKTCGNRRRNANDDEFCLIMDDWIDGELECDTEKLGCASHSEFKAKALKVSDGELRAFEDAISLMYRYKYDNTDLADNLYHKLKDIYFYNKQPEQSNISEKEVKSLKSSLDFYKTRCDQLQKAQSDMRDPERKMVCDILANGKLDPFDQSNKQTGESK